MTCAEAGFVAGEVLAAREHEAHRTTKRQRRTHGQRLDEGELAAERAAERLGDHADALEREVERPRELPRVTNEPCVLVETTSVPDGSSQAVQTCGSMYAW